MAYPSNEHAVKCKAKNNKKNTGYRIKIIDMYRKS